MVPDFCACVNLVLCCTLIQIIVVLGLINVGYLSYVCVCHFVFPMFNQYCYSPNKKSSIPSIRQCKNHIFCFGASCSVMGTRNHSQCTKQKCWCIMISGGSRILTSVGPSIVVELSKIGWNHPKLKLNYSIIQINR